MSTILDVKYINLLSSQLDRFTRATDNTYRFRCPFCGDSKKLKNKTRGYFYLHENVWRMKCHNCGHSTNVYGVLEHVNPELMKAYVFEKFKETGQSSPRDVAEKKAVVPSILPYMKTPLSKLKKVSQLAPDHLAKRYVVDRMIPSKYHYKLFYTDNFKRLANEFISGKFEKFDLPDQRLVVPFIDRDGNLIAFQGRALYETKVRYITILVNENLPRVYGLDNVDMRQLVYVAEGPINSMFVDNCLAMGGADLVNLESYSGTKFAFIYDNEFRNKEIVKRMEKMINLGHGIVLLPNSLDSQDINDMIRNGKSQASLMEMIKTHTYFGLSAKTNFKFWSMGQWH